MAAAERHCGTARGPHLGAGPGHIFCVLKMGLEGFLLDLEVANGKESLRDGENKPPS